MNDNPTISYYGRIFTDNERNSSLVSYPLNPRESMLDFAARSAIDVNLDKLAERDEPTQ